MGLGSKMCIVPLERKHPKQSSKGWSVCQHLGSKGVKFCSVWSITPGRSTVTWTWWQSLWTTVNWSTWNHLYMTSHCLEPVQMIYLSLKKTNFFTGKNFYTIKTYWPKGFIWMVTCRWYLSTESIPAEK